MMIHHNMMSKNRLRKRLKKSSIQQKYYFYFFAHSHDSSFYNIAETHIRDSLVLKLLMYLSSLLDCYPLEGEGYVISLLESPPALM